MAKLNIALLWVCTIASCRLQSISAGYTKIDEYLKQTVDSDDVESNLNAAEKWLSQNPNFKCSLLARNPTEDFQMFAALRKVLGEGKCNEESFKIMRENEMNIGDLFTKIHSEAVKRRVDNVVWKIFEQHAKNCQDVWPTLLKRKLRQVDDQKKLMRAGVLAESILSETLSTTVFSSYKQLYDRFIGNLLELKDLRRSKSIYQKLNEYAKDDPDVRFMHPVIEDREGKKAGKKVVRTDKIRDLVDRHLVEPCSYFVGQLGPEVFIPARWDATTLPPSSEDIRFYKYWTDFRICEVVTQNAKTLTKDLARIVEKELE